jgi:hypothetical protein
MYVFYRFLSYGGGSLQISGSGFTFLFSGSRYLSHPGRQALTVFLMQLLYISPEVVILTALRRIAV